jgi:hypothetical protein
VQPSAVVEQLPHGLDLKPYGVQHPPVEGLSGEQLAQLLVAGPHLLDVLLHLQPAAAPLVRSPTLVDALIGWTQPPVCAMAGAGSPPAPRRSLRSLLDRCQLVGGQAEPLLARLILPGRDPAAQPYAAALLEGLRAGLVPIECDDRAELRSPVRSRLVDRHSQPQPLTACWRVERSKFKEHCGNRIWSFPPPFRSPTELRSRQPWASSDSSWRRQLNSNSSSERPSKHTRTPPPLEAFPALAEFSALGSWASSAMTRLATKARGRERTRPAPHLSPGPRASAEWLLPGPLVTTGRPMPASSGRSAPSSIRRGLMPSTSHTEVVDTAISAPSTRWPTAGSESSTAASPMGPHTRAVSAGRVVPRR